jgi:hypothetical protein
LDDAAAVDERAAVLRNVAFARYPSGGGVSGSCAANLANASRFSVVICAFSA